MAGRGLFSNCLSIEMGVRAEDSETDLLALLRLEICHWGNRKVRKLKQGKSIWKWKQKSSRKGMCVIRYTNKYFKAKIYWIQCSITNFKQLPAGLAWNMDDSIVWYQLQHNYIFLTLVSVRRDGPEKILVGSRICLSSRSCVDRHMASYTGPGWYFLGGVWNPPRKYWWVPEFAYHPGTV